MKPSEKDIRKLLGLKDTEKFSTLVSHLRYVYASEDKVLKLDRFSSSSELEKQTIIEAKRYKEIPRGLKKHFPRLIKTGRLRGSLYIIQERIIFKNPRSPHNRFGEYRKLRDKILKKTTWDLCDTDHNWGVRKDTNEIVIYDFAL